MENVLKVIYQKALETTDYQAYLDLKDYCREVMRTDIPLGVKYLSLLSNRLEEVIPRLRSEEEMKKMYELHKSVLLLGAPHNFHMYLLYVESNREPSKKFYPPPHKWLSNKNLQGNEANSKSECSYAAVIGIMGRNAVCLRRI